MNRNKSKHYDLHHTTPSWRAVYMVGYVEQIGAQTTEVIIESKNKVFINIFGIPQSKRNVETLSDYIQNRVYRLCSDEELHLNTNPIRFAQPNIPMRS